MILDYRNIILLKSARNFRTSALRIIADPEYTSSLEDELDDVKYIPVSQHTEMIEELARHAEAIADFRRYIRMYSMELNETQKLWEPTKAEHDEVTERVGKILGLDKWCGGCKEGFGYCDSRVAYLAATYGTKEFEAKTKIMEKGQCILK